MKLEIDGGGKVAFGIPPLQWVDSRGDGSIMQICRVSGQEMMAITDWNPFDRNANGPHFFADQEQALAHAVAVVARVSGMPESAVGSI